LIFDKDVGLGVVGKLGGFEVGLLGIV